MLNQYPTNIEELNNFSMKCFHILDNNSRLREEAFLESSSKTINGSFRRPEFKKVEGTYTS
jgi:ribosome maturation factor RimP